MQHLDEGVLHALVDGEVPSSELGPIQAHLDQCADCRVRLDDARATAGESTALIELIEVPAGAPPAAMRSVPRPAVSWMRPLALAASLGVAVGLGYAGGRLQDDPNQAPMLQVDTLYLSDGSAVSQETRLKDEPDAAVSPAPAETRSGQPSIGQAREQERAQEPGQRQSVPGEREADRSAEAAAPAPAPARSQSGRDTVTDRMRSNQFREELTVTNPTGPKRIDAAGRAADHTVSDSLLKRSLSEGAAKSVPAAPQASMEAAVTSLRVVPITFTDAVTLLGGQIRLIDGMVPARLEASGTAVRVVYRLERGELILEQRRMADSVSVALVAPWLSSDSVGKLRQRIR